MRQTMVSLVAPIVLLCGCSAPSAPPPTLRALYGQAPPARLASAHTAVVLVDTQREFADGKLALPRLAPAAARTAELLAWARARRLLVVHVRQVPRDPASKLFTPGTPLALPLAGLEPREGEWVVAKPGGGAFTIPDLDARLRAAGVDRLIVAGFMTHLAVAATVSDAAQLGYAVIVAGDATATRDLAAADGGAPLAADAVQRTSLAALGDRFADVLDTARILRLEVVPPSS